MSVDREKVQFRIGGLAGGLRLVTGTACRERHPNMSGLVCDLPRAHHPSDHVARWWAEYGHVLRRKWRRFMRKVKP